METDVKLTRNKENIIIINRTQLFIFQMFIIKLRNWIIQFKLRSRMTAGS